jgi:hypothetical protein
MQKATRPTAEELQTERRLWFSRDGCAYMRWTPAAWGYQGVQLELQLRIPFSTSNQGTRPDSITGWSREHTSL